MRTKGLTRETGEIKEIEGKVKRETGVQDVRVIGGRIFLKHAALGKAYSRENNRPTDFLQTGKQSKEHLAV